MLIKISDEKLRDVRAALTRVIGGGSLRAKTVAKAIGKLIATEAALGPVVQLLSRAAQYELAQATEQSWKVQLQLTQQASQGLREMANSLEEFNGYPIKNVATAKKLDAFIEPSKETEGKEAPTQLLRLESTTRKVVAGDASAVATCALEVGEGEGTKLFTQNKLEGDERRLSSGHRELLTVLRALQQEPAFFDTLKNQTIIWLTDSTNLVSFLTKGTIKMKIQEHVMEVFRLLASFQIRLVPVHLKRSDFRIQWADEGSRSFDPDDWGIDTQSYRDLTRVWQPTLDAFAHTSNAKCSKFYSYGAAPRSAGVDAFAQNWTDELAFVCPPVHLITDALKKIESTEMMAILVVPAWRTATFWSIIFPDGKHAVTSCVNVREFRPHIVRGKYCTNKLMQGKTAFPFLALYMRSTGQGHTHKSGRTEYH